MTIQYEIEALIVDIPFMWMLQIIGTKPSNRKKRKVMPLVLSSLVKSDIIEWLKNT
jgi:hypothetical protein